MRGARGFRWTSCWPSSTAARCEGPALLTVVAYDIREDGRRARLADTLKNYGVRVQYSVFECDLTEKEFEQMRLATEQLVNRREDRIAYYRLCQPCERRVDQHPVRVSRRLPSAVLA